MFAQYNTHDWGVVLARQFETTYRAFDVGKERGPFYPTGEPILPVLWAALWMLGTAYLVWRAGDVRFAVLGLWLLSGLAGAALTIETPTLQRVAGMVPTLALIPALYLDRVATGAPPLRWRVPWRSRAGLLRGAMAGLVSAAADHAGSADALLLLRPVRAAGMVLLVLAGRALCPYAGLPPGHVYQMDAPETYWWNGPGLFLADRVTGRDLSNLSDDLPITDEHGKNAHFLVFNTYMAYFPTLQHYLPHRHLAGRPPARRHALPGRLPGRAGHLRRPPPGDGPLRPAGGPAVRAGRTPARHAGRGRRAEPPAAVESLPPRRAVDERAGRPGLRHSTGWT